jgi:quercetin dioxygenase-like cupin family protein
MNKGVRRVVTGHDANGKAVVVSDGPAPFVHQNPLNADWNSTDIWRTLETPAPVVIRAEESTLGPRRQMPTANGTVIRINSFPPDTQDITDMTPAEARKAFAALGNESASTFGRGGRHPMMHRTETIDYAIVLSGEIDMLLDDTDVHLSEGDVVVQCGTNHAWVNRSSKPCRVAFILIDGKFDPELSELLHKADAAQE